MEYTIEEYRRTVGKVFQSKSKDNFVYLRCVFFRDGCKGTCKLNRESDLVTPLKLHNHNIDAYRNEIFALKRKCKTAAKNSETNLRKVFDDVTRNNPRPCEISFSECESTMFRTRKTLEPRIPPIALELSETSAHTLARSLHDVSCANNNRFAVVVCFQLAFHTSEMPIFFKIFEF